MPNMFQYMNEQVIGTLKALGMKPMVHEMFAHAPRRIQRWAKNKIMERRIHYRQRLVPEKELTEKYHAVLLNLLEKYGTDALGDYLEFGVYNGTSLACMHRVLEELALHDIRLFGFDSFEGLPATASTDDDGNWFPGQFSADYELTHRILTLGKVNWNRVFLVKGWFSDTLNDELIDKFQLRKASVIMIDCDMYLSAKQALDFCAPLIQDDCLLFFDDWNSGGLAEKNLGEKRAFTEFLTEHPYFNANEIESYTTNAKVFWVSRSQACSQNFLSTEDYSPISRHTNIPKLGEVTTKQPVLKRQTKSANILGISAFYHDSAAALIRDGEIMAAAQEERFTRYKGDANFPTNAVQSCLRQGMVEIRDLDYVVFYENPLAKFDRLMETFVTFASQSYESFRKALPLWASHRLQLRDVIAAELGEDFIGELCFVNHHESHAASAFFPSPFDEAAILTLDAVGEWATSSIGNGKGNKIELTHEMRFPHSLGMLYSAFTYYTGFKVNSGEYKLMGLAPYGEPKYVDLILQKIAHIHEDGSLWLDMSYFNYCQGMTMTSEKFHGLFGKPPRQPENHLTQQDMDLAASIQAICEEVVLRSARHAHQLTGMTNLVLAGGVALNCVANGRLKREGPFEKIWIQPAAGDAGSALGAALLVWHHQLDMPRQGQVPDGQKGSLLGPAFENDRIQLFLDANGAKYEYISDETILLDRVADLLDQEKVIGWFQGPMEFGPRALGCRSIIGDARSPRMQQIMNLKIKFRESFRPFAPCVLREFASDVFELEQDEDNPYMLFVAPVRKEWRIPLGQEDCQKMQDPDLRVRVAVPRSKVPAVTHVDYSARVQTVDEVRHGRLYRLMRRFHELTQCPVIVNTSFNIRGEPIVGAPEDAYQCFMATEMDCLIIENYILLKDQQIQGLLPNLDAYRNVTCLD